MKINFVAEVGVNHEGSLESAQNHIRQAAASGARAVKFQAYSASMLASENSPSYWDVAHESETSQFKLFSRYDKFTLDDYKVLAQTCEEQKVEFMVTCFDEDWLQKLDHLVARHKVASADITNVRLLKKIAPKGKPVILSTGASSLQEVENAVNILRSNGANDIVLMHCVLCYPTNNADANLSRINFLRRIADNFGLPEIGYSDHTIPTINHEVLLAAITLGATWIEKHFSLTPNTGGNDHYHSFGPLELVDFFASLRNLEKILAYDESDFLTLQTSARKNARRGLYAARDLTIGSEIGNDDLIELRPVGIIASEEIDSVLGRKLISNLKKGDLISYDALE